MEGRRSGRADQLTSGSTWHAAGGFHTLNGDPNVAKLQGYTIGLYDELERISGQPCGLHRPGGLLLADTPERMEWLEMAHGRGRYLGLETSLLTPREARELLPLIEEKYFVGAMLDAADGNLDPYGTTHAYAKSARIGGAELYERTRVTALHAGRTARGTSRHRRARSTPSTSSIAAGLWAREVGRMVGLELPVLAMEHMYLVTDDMPEVIEYNQTHGRELPHAIDFGAEIYMRQERNGIVLGTYEKDWCRGTADDALGLRRRAAAAGSRPDRALSGACLRAFPRHEARRHQARHQRPVHILARRQPARGAGAGPSRLLVRLRGDGGLQPGRRCRSCALSMDGPRRSGLRRLGDGRRALWRVGDAAHTNEKVRENYARRFSIRFPTKSCPPPGPSKPPRCMT